MLARAAGFPKARGLFFCEVAPGEMYKQSLGKGSDLCEITEFRFEFWYFIE